MFNFLHVTFLKLKPRYRLGFLDVRGIGALSPVETTAQTKEEIKILNEKADRTLNQSFLEVRPVVGYDSHFE